MRNNIWKKLLATTLALMMITSLGMSSGALRARADGVYAENETKTVEGNVDYATAYSKEGEVTDLTVVGDVISNGSNGASASAYDGGSTTMKTGDVTFTYADPEYNYTAVQATTSGADSNVDLTVGDITASGSGFTSSNNGGTIEAETGSITAGTYGANIYGNDDYNWEEVSSDVFTAVTSGQSVETWENTPPPDIDPYSRYSVKTEHFRAADGTDYYHYIYNDGTESWSKQWYTPVTGNTEIRITDSVAVVNDSRTDYYIWGVEAYTNSDGQNIDVLVTGDISVDNRKGNGGAEGVRVSTSNDDRAGTVSVVVDGDVSVASQGNSSGVDVWAGDGGALAVVDNIDVAGESATGANVSVVDGSGALVAGNITVATEAQWGTGAYLTLNGDGTASLAAKDVTYVSTSEGSDGRAVSVRTDGGNEDTPEGGQAILIVDNITSSGSGLEISNYNEGAEVTATTSDVKAANTAVSIWTEEGTTTEVKTGALESSESTGLNIVNYGGELTAKTGEIKANNTGASISGQGNYIHQDLTADEFAALTGGKISSSWTNDPPSNPSPDSRYSVKGEYYGDGNIEYYHYTYNDGTEDYYKFFQDPTVGSTEVTITGGVTVVRNDTGNTASGISAYATTDEQEVHVAVNGDISVENKAKNGEAQGIRVSNDRNATSNTTVVVDGNIDVTADNYVSGVSVQAGNGTSTVVTGNVDVSGSNGHGARVSVEDGAADLVVGNISVAAEDYGTGLDADLYGIGELKVEAGDISLTNTGTDNSGTALSISMSGGSSETSEQGSSAKVTAGNIASDAQGVSIDNFSGDAVVTIGDVNAVHGGIGVWGSRESTTTVTAGDITNDYWTAVDVHNSGRGAEVTVTTGDISFGNNPGNYSSNGLNVNLQGEGGTTTVTVGDVTGTVDCGGTAVAENVYGDGTANVTTGDVTLKDGITEEGEYYNVAVRVETGTTYDYDKDDVYKEIGGATATLTAGNVTSDFNGVSVYNNSGIVNVTVGNVKAQDEGAYVSVSKSGETSFTAGDIASTDGTAIGAGNQGGTLKVKTGALSGNYGLSVSASRANEWEWLSESEFDELGLGEPSWTDTWEDDEGIVHYSDIWSFDDCEYHRYRYEYEGEEYKDYEKVTYSDVEGSTTAYVGGDIDVKHTDWTSGVSFNVDSAKQYGLVEVDGNISAESTGGSVEGGYVGTSDGGEAALVVNGNISATGKTWTGGFAIYANSDSSADVLINGDISATSTDEFAVGFQMNANGEAVANALINGDITATGETSDGVEIFNNSGTLTLTVVGDVTSNDTGIEANSGNWLYEYLEGTIEVDESELTYYSIDKDGKYTWKEYIHKDGDKEIHYDENGNQWILKTPEGEPETTTSIEVIGDVTGSDDAVILNVNGEKAKIDMIVDGTLSGEENGVVLKAETVTDNIALTVWEIKPNEEGAVASRQTGIWTEDEKGKWSTTTVEDEAFEQQIQYIIRVEQPTKGSVDTLGTTEYEGYNVAKEGQTVTLKVNVPAGYRLKNAYNGTDTKVQLAKDGNGDYYLIVPRGGAVTLSVTLERIPQKPKTDEEITEAVEELIAETEPEEAANTKVEVQTDDDGKKTVVLTPTETATETAVAVSNALIAEIVKANVENIAIAGKSEKAQVVLQSAAIEKIIKENDSAHLIVDIDEDTKQTEEAIEKVPTGLKVLEGAVRIQVKLVDKEGNSTTLGTNENIKVSLKLEYTEGLQIVFVGNDGVAVTVEPVWVEATDTVPGHWEVPYMGVGSYIPVVPET